MALALDLGYRGAQCMLIEQGDGTIEQPKIGLISVRTMEFFRRWGIDDRVRNCGFPDDYKLSMVFCTSLAGPELDREEYPSIRDMPALPWTTEKKQRCPQLWLNPILQKAAEEQKSVSMHFRWKLEKFEQFDTHVIASVTDLTSGEPVSIRAKYLVGCDGVASQVRSALGIEMEGNPKLSYSVSILVRTPDVLRHFDKGQAERYIFVGPEGTWGNWTVVDGKDLWRLTVLGSIDKLDLERFDASAWVKRALGRDDVSFEVLSVLPWRRSELIAERYRSGRVILAGDSAHTMSPTGGMGMNTGMGDAVDLGWKLDAVLKGWGTEELIASYETERRPVAIRNAAFSTHNWKAWHSPKDCAAILDDTEEGERLRQEVGAGLRAATKVDWESWGLQMGYRYEDSPICVPDGSPAASDDFASYLPTARPGSRAPHAWLPDGRSTLDLFGREFVLLAFSDARREDVMALQASAQRLRVPLSVMTIDDPAIRQLYEQALVLVRPDGHVAWRGVEAKMADLVLDTVRGQVRAGVTSKDRASSASTAVSV
jgi:2-polyprenyl-6-methoxyphenol hydroxylase-like FAD-dependent oxidoreductase